jgi:PPOX class probable F420-dependent enzyme
MELTDALAFAAERRNGVLVALKRDGRPQLSNIVYAVGDDGVVRISITADRAKYANLVRDPRISLHISRDDFWGYVVLEGDAELSAVAEDPADATVDELVDLYRALAGEHSNWEEYRAAMVADRRLVVRLRPSRAYGMLGG